MWQNKPDFTNPTNVSKVEELISIAKLSSKDKFYSQLLVGMSLQIWGFSTETLKNEEIPNNPPHVE